MPVRARVCPARRGGAVASNRRRSPIPDSRRTTSDDIEAEILAISDAWDTALVSNDAPAIAAFMADEWVFVAPGGMTPKADLIGWIATGRLVHLSMRLVGAPRVAVHGTLVILTARKASSGTWDGTAYTADEWITEVYVRDRTYWSCVLSHKSATE